MPFPLPTWMVELLAKHLLRPLKGHAAVDARCDRRKHDQSDGEIHEKFFRRDGHSTLSLTQAACSPSSGYCIPSRILNPCLREAFTSDEAAITPSASQVAHRIVATMR